MKTHASTTRSGLAVASAVALLIPIAACTAQPTDASAGSSTLTFGVDGTIPNIDPILADNNTVDPIAVATYDALVDYTPDGELAGKLAEKWTVAPDAKSISVTLRDGAKFHDGATVTSKDVKYTLDRIKRLGVGVANSIAAYESTTVTSDTELTINLNQASSLFLGGLSRIYILNSALVDKHAGNDQGQAWLASNEAGSGPYRLKKYSANQSITFTRSSDYFAGENAKNPRNVVYRLIPESSTQQKELLRGTIDVSDGIDPVDLDALKKSDGFQTITFKKPQELYVFFNTQRAPLDNPKVRQAIRLSYDYANHKAKILHGFGEVATGVLPATVACRPDAEPQKQDLARAKDLLAQAGMKNLKLKMGFQAMFSEHAEAATSLQSSLRDVGIDLELVSMSYPAYMESLKKVESTPDLALLWDNPPTPDAGSLLSTRYGSKYAGTSTNYGQYKNEEVDRLLDEARTSGDAQLQCENYKKVQTILEDDSVSMPIADEVTVIVAPKNVKGLKLYPAHVGYVPQSYELS